MTVLVEDGVLSYMVYIGMCNSKGKDFQPFSSFTELFASFTEHTRLPMISPAKSEDNLLLSIHVLKNLVF